jgi:hypothetical protein
VLAVRLSLPLPKQILTFVVQLIKMAIFVKQQLKQIVKVLMETLRLLKLKKLYKNQFNLNKMPKLMQLKL